MRAYARQQLAAGELGRLQRAHAEHYAAFAERAGPELLGPAQLEWQHRIRAELDNLQAAVTWALTSGDQARPLAFRIVAALAVLPSHRRSSSAAGPRPASPSSARARPSCAPRSWPQRHGARSSPATFRWRNGGPRTPCENRYPAIRSAAGRCDVLLAQICTLTGQPERGASIAREARQEAAGRGIEILVGILLAMEAMAWTAAGDYAAARPPAMEAVEIARRVRNPALSATAFYAAAAAIWRGEPQAALALIEDSLALTRAGAFDPALGFALSLAAAIRARNGDLPGALAALEEATVQQHADGNRLGLGVTLQIAAAVLARLGEAEPAAVLAGAVSAHFPPRSSPFPKMSGSRSTKPCPSPATRSARPPTAPRSGAAPRWTMTRSSATRWASSGGSPRCSQNPARRHRNQPRPGAAEPQEMTTITSRS